MATWPSTLRAPVISGYGLNPVDQTVRTDMEIGAAKTRRRTQARNDKLNVSWVFKDAEMATFRAFFDDSTTGISGGASWFTMSVAIGTTGLVSMECRFVGPFKASLMPGLIWQVSAELEIR